MVARRSRYRLLPYSRARRAAQDLEVAQRKHLIHALIEADITHPRACLRAYRRRTGDAVSMTAFVIGCVARAVDERKTMQAYRQGKRHLIIFEDVDVTTLIEREIAGERRVLFHIVRAANRKSPLEIHREIHRAQGAASARSMDMVALKVFEVMPRTLRRTLIRLAARTPRLWKRFGGTVAVTAVGMFGKGGGWGIPITTNTLDVTIGGVSKKPTDVEGAIAVREYLNLTVSVDHDVVDGAPVARFTSRLRELIEGAYGLEAPSISGMRETTGVAAQR